MHLRATLYQKINKINTRLVCDGKPWKSIWSGQKTVQINWPSIEGSHTEHQLLKKPSRGKLWLENKTITSIPEKLQMLNFKAIKYHSTHILFQLNFFIQPVFWGYSWWSIYCSSFILSAIRHFMNNLRFIIHFLLEGELHFTFLAIINNFQRTALCMSVFVKVSLQNREK